jgi:hypothetical protein
MKMEIDFMVNLCEFWETIGLEARSRRNSFNGTGTVVCFSFQSYVSVPAVDEKRFLFDQMARSRVGILA